MFVLTIAFQGCGFLFFIIRCFVYQEWWPWNKWASPPGRDVNLIFVDGRKASAMGRDKSRWVRPINRGNPYVSINQSGKSVFICQKTSQLTDSLIDSHGLCDWELRR